MHELSIVMGIVDIAKDEAAKAGVSSFSVIELEIGTLAGVVMEALDFAWQSAVKDTVLEKAERRIKMVDAVAKCEECGHEFKAMTLYDECPECGSFFTELIMGNELKVKSLEYEN